MVFMTYQIISERKAPPYRITCPADAFKVFMRYAKAKTERFIVASLNGSHEVIKIRIVSVGLVGRCLVSAREVFVGPITDMATAVVVSHNHPSGHHESVSEEDIAISHRLSDAGELLGIPLLDHIVTSRNGYTSLNERGFLKSSHGE
jgi:DNA repair protein RadC